jgi:hypothetical protein
MKIISSAILASLLATVSVGAPVHAEDVKLFSEGKQIGVYKNSYALIIGNSDYDNENDLPRAHADIDVVRKALLEQGFQDQDIEVYIDTTGGQLRSRIEEFVDKHGYEKDARILIWYAGHGATVNGEGYLLGKDVPVIDQRSKTIDDDVRKFYKASFPLRTFGVVLRQMQAKHVMLVLDSCFAATIFDSTRSPSQRAREIEMANPTRQIITAGGTGQKVADDGKFAQAFADAITGKAVAGGKKADSNGDGYLTGTELGYYLSQAVETTLQKPQYGKLQSLASNSRDYVDGISIGSSNYELGEFFFKLPGNHDADEQDPHVVPKAPVAVSWRELEENAHILVGADPAPVYTDEPPGIGDKRYSLRSREQFPQAGVTVKFEVATIQNQTWVRFREGDDVYYVRVGDVTIVRP